MCGTVCMSASGPPNPVWGGRDRVGNTLYVFCYGYGLIVVQCNQAKRKLSDHRVSPTGLSGKRKLTATSSLLGYFSGLAKVADQPTSDL